MRAGALMNPSILFEKIMASMRGFKFVMRERRLCSRCVLPAARGPLNGSDGYGVFVDVEDIRKYDAVIEYFPVSLVGEEEDALAFSLRL
jgi:hypothetical protein